MEAIKQGLAMLLAFFACNVADAKPITEERVVQLAKIAGAQYGLDWSLLASIAFVESSYNPKAVGSSHGEIGLMQLRPEYFPEASFEAHNSMFMAAKYLKNLKTLCSKRGKAWYTCYNTGPYRDIAYPHELAYFQKVEKQRERLRQRYAPKATERQLASN